MAFQTGIIKLRGTIGDLTYYYRRGKYLCCKKSSLNRDRILNDPAFEKIRQHQPIFGAASRLASIVHGQLSPAQKRHVPNYKLIKEIVPLLRQKLSVKKIIAHLQSRYGILMKGFKRLKSICHIIASAYRQSAPTAVQPPVQYSSPGGGAFSMSLEMLQKISKLYIAPPDSDVAKVA